MKSRFSFRAVVWTAFAAVAFLSLTAGVGAVQGDKGSKKVYMYDDCDRATFNAVLGSGACVGNGHTTFDDFIAELEATQDAHLWKFQPKAISVNVGRPIFIDNRGGEVHTFTKVAAFGGGFVGDLNDLSGNPVPAPECLDFGSLVFVFGGDFQIGPTAGSAELPVGTSRFQCCIHPWMRSVVQVQGGTAQANKPAAAAEHHTHH